MDSEEFKSLMGELGTNLSTLAVSGTALGRCRNEDCPTHRVEMAFKEYADDEGGACWPSGHPLFVCPTCQTGLRLVKLEVKAVKLGDED